jgi:hypothetical protein
MNGINGAQKVGSEWSAERINSACKELEKGEQNTKSNIVLNGGGRSLSLSLSRRAAGKCVCIRI